MDSGFHKFLQDREQIKKELKNLQPLQKGVRVNLKNLIIDQPLRRQMHPPKSNRWHSCNPGGGVEGGVEKMSLLLKN